MSSKILLALLSAGLIFRDAWTSMAASVPGSDWAGAFNALDPSVPVYRSSNYVVTSEMPPVRYETRSVVPAGYSDPVWINGYWGWGGSDWVWVPGRWVERPHSNVGWTDGRYYEDNGLEILALRLLAIAGPGAGQSRPTSFGSSFRSSGKRGKWRARASPAISTGAEDGAGKFTPPKGGASARGDFVPKGMTTLLVDVLVPDDGELARSGREVEQDRVSVAGIGHAQFLNRTVARSTASAGPTVRFVTKTRISPRVEFSAA